MPGGGNPLRGVSVLLRQDGGDGPERGPARVAAPSRERAPLRGLVRRGGQLPAGGGGPHRQRDHLLRQGGGGRVLLRGVLLPLLDGHTAQQPQARQVPEVGGPVEQHPGLRQARGPVAVHQQRGAAGEEVRHEQGLCGLSRAVREKGGTCGSRGSGGHRPGRGPAGLPGKRGQV